MRVLSLVHLLSVSALLSTLVATVPVAPIPHPTPLDHGATSPMHIIARPRPTSLPRHVATVRHHQSPDVPRVSGTHWYRAAQYLSPGARMRQEAPLTRRALVPFSLHNRDRTSSADIPGVSITPASATVDGVSAGIFPVIDFNPQAWAGVQATYCTLNTPGDPVFAADSNSRPMIDVIPHPGHPCTTQVLPGSAGAFTLDLVAGLVVASAGPQTFAFYHDDSFNLYIGPNNAGQQPTPADPSTAGPRTGYPLIGGAGGWGDDTLTVDFPAPGIYPMEVTLYENGGGELGLTMGTSVQDPLPSASALSVSELLGAQSKSLLACNCQSGHFPVNGATGNFWHTFTDLSIPGRGIPLQVVRTYNSRAATQDGPLGYGWSMNNTMALTTDATGSISVTEEGGSVVTFSPVPGGYQAPSHVLATLVPNADGTLTFTRRDQQHFTFTAPTTTTPGLLLAETDQNGYVTALSYVNGMLTTITDPAGRTLTFTYSRHHIARISDSGGRAVTFTYDDAGNLTDSHDVGGGVTQYTYDSAHLLLTMTDPRRGQISNIYDPTGRVLSQTDPLSRTTTYTYTANTDGSQTTTTTDPNGHVIVDQFANNLWISHTSGYGTPQQATWTYTYDQATLGVASATDPDGHTSYNSYDPHGNLLSHADALGRTTTYTYDALNDVTSVTDPKGLTTLMTYDMHGNFLGSARPVTVSTTDATPTVLATATSTSAPATITMSVPNATPTSAGARTEISGTEPAATPTATATSAVAAMHTLVLSSLSVVKSLPSTGQRHHALMGQQAGWMHSYQPQTARPASPLLVAPRPRPAPHVHGLHAPLAPSVAAAEQDVHTGVFLQVLLQMGAGSSTDVQGSTPAPSRILRRRPTRTPTATATLRRVRRGHPTATATVTPARTPTARSTATATATPKKASCALYPIALSARTLAGVTRGAKIVGIASGTRPDHFGWLTWTGATSLSSLLVSLTPPGNSATYTTPNHPADHTLSPGDEVLGRPDTLSSSATRAISATLATLSAQAITVPVWDTASTRGATTRYRISAFARVRLLRWEWDRGRTRLSLRFLGPVTCAGTRSLPTDTPTVTPVATDTPLLTSTATPRAMVTETPPATPTSTATASPRPTWTATGTPTATATIAPPAPPPPTSTPTMPTARPSATSTQQPSATGTPTRTLTPTATGTPTATATPVPSDTPTTTSTLRPTATVTSTRTGATTPTEVATAPPSATSTPRPTETATSTATGTAPPPPTPPLSATDMPTPTARASGTSMSTPTSMPTATAPLTGTPTRTPSLTASPTSTTTSSSTATATGTPSVTSSSTVTATGTSLLTMTPTGTATVTVTPTLSSTASSTPTQAATVTETPVPTGIPTQITATATTTSTRGAASCPPSSPNTATVCLTYDPAHPGDVIARTDPNGHTTSFTYDGYGDRTQATDPLGHSTTMTYDLIGRMTSMVRPNGNVAGATPLSATTTYTYTALGDLASTTDALGQVTSYSYDGNRNRTSATDALGRTTTNTYNGDNQLIRVTRPDGGVLQMTYDGAGNLTSQTDPLSHTVTYAYDPLNRRISQTDLLGRVTTYAYDGVGNRTSITDPKGQTTAFGYDAANEQVRLTRPDGAVLTRGYDLDGHVITATDALGRPTTSVYDSLNRMIAQTDPLSRTTISHYDPAGNLIALTDPLSRTTSYSYDAANKRTRTTRADGSVHQMAYDADGNLISSTDALSHTTSYGYDALDRLVRVTDPLSHTTTSLYDAVGNRTSTTDALGHTTTYGYDALNRVTSTSDALGHTTLVAYDLAGNRVSVTDPLSHTTGYAYDAAQEQTAVIRADGTALTMAYDANGNKITGTDALSQTTVYTYDVLNRLVAVMDPLSHTTTSLYDAVGNRTSTTDALGQTTTSTYNAGDERTRVTHPDGTAASTGYDAVGNVITQTDTLSYTTVYTYDALDRVVSTTDPLSRTTGYSYDAEGNRTSLVDPQGRTTTYSYDAANRRIGVSYSDGTTPPVSYTYTATDQRATMTDGTGTTSYSYDALDRVMTTTTGAGHSLGYGYDGASNLTTLVYPDGATITRTYDVLNRMSGVSDWLGHTTQFGYNAADNLITQTYPNTTTARFSYNGANELTGIVDQGAAGPLWTYRYGRDALGQVSSSADPLEGITHTYTYDPRTRLTGDQQPGGAGSWGYNAGYGLTQMVNVTQGTTSTLSYDPGDQLTHLTTSLGGATTQDVRFTYNGNGDRTAQSDAVSGASTTYGYDQADRLITATVGITTATYGYDGDGLRQSKTISGTFTQQTWDTTSGLPLLLQDGGTRYVTGPDGLPIEQIGPDGTVLYYYQDRLGSTRALLDGTGQAVATYTYSPYGSLTSRTGMASTPFGYAGQYTDAESGLQYLRARYYDPATAQFLSRDPLVDQTGQAYAYGADDPINATDPSGLRCYGFDPLCSVRETLTGPNNSNVRTALVTLNNFDTSNLSNAVSNAVRPSCMPWAQLCRLDTPDEAGRTLGQMVSGLVSIPFGTGVAGGPSSACDVGAYDAQVARDQQLLDTDATNANLAMLAMGGAGPALNLFRLGAADAGTAASLSSKYASTFMGGRYTVRVLTQDEVFYRAGISDPGKQLGEFFSKDPPVSVIQTRIDRAIPPRWPNGISAPLDTGFAVLIPKGTTVYEGTIAPQGEIYLGGTMQTVIIEPWNISGARGLRSWRLVQ